MTDHLSSKSSSQNSGFAEQWLSAAYGNQKWIYLFWPLSILFFLLQKFRIFYLKNFVQKPLSVPIIIVGNITLGGTGKTPVIIALVEYFQSQQKKVGVISRGYGSQLKQFPYLLNEQSTAIESGDEPLLIYQRTGAAVCVAPNRVEAAQELIRQGCDLLLSDDGLQHYALPRNLELVVVDAGLGFGNRQLIPAGPLREPLSRLNQSDFLLINSTQKKGDHLVQVCTIPSVQFCLKPQQFIHVQSGKKISPEKFVKQIKNSENIFSVAAIGNPQRFFSSVKSLGIESIERAFPDHYFFQEQDLTFVGDNILLVTEKDAVKLKPFAKEHWYALQVGIEFESSFFDDIKRKS